MASRKKSEGQSTLFAVPPPVDPPRAASLPLVAQAPVEEAVAERPKLRLVEALAADDITVEAAQDGAFWIERIRDHGTTSAAMLVTRSQLERLISRAQAALEVG